MSEEKVLPPFVYGKLRGHLTVKVDEIFWVKTSPGNIFVEFVWWGEKESHIFKPVCINKPSNVNEEDISITFNIRTSLQLFENYIKKSGKLVLGVFKFPSREHVGDVTVWNPANSIFSGKLEQGYYPIFNKNKIRIGDLKISFELWMANKDISDKESGKSSTNLPVKSTGSKSTSIPPNSNMKGQEENAVDPLFDVLNRGRELRDAMTMSVLDDVPVDNIEKIISSGNTDNHNNVNSNPALIDANKLMDFLMGKELPPDEEVLAIKTLRSVSPTQSVVNHEIKSRVTSSRSCSCCFKHNNSCSSYNSRSLSNPNSGTCSRQHTSEIINRLSKDQREEAQQSKHIIELVNCFKLVVQCLHLNSLGVKKVKGNASKTTGKVQKKPGLYYMIEHLPGSQTNLSKEKPWNLKQTRFVSRKINDNEIIFGESNNFVEGLNGSFSWPKVLKQLNGTSLKVYWRYHNQRLPCYLGSCIIKDDSVNPSGLFSTFTLPVNSNSGITVGHLSLLLELGHNRKTFGSRLLNFDLKESNKENASCECSGFRGAEEDRYDAIWGRDMEKKARDMMISSHNQCCHSACDKNPPTRASSYSERLCDSRAKSLRTESRKSSENSSEQYRIRESGKEKVLSKNEDKGQTDDGISTKDQSKGKLITVPTNIPESLKSTESSDSISYKSDSVRNDLKLDVGNIRPGTSTTDASCQVTLDRNTKSTQENSPGIRLCKSCLAMSEHKSDMYSSKSSYNPDMPIRSNIDRFYNVPMYRNHRDPIYYPNRYQNYCHCCPSEFPSSHKCCYEMASTQINAAHLHNSDIYYSEYQRCPPLSSYLTTARHPHYSEPMTVHEISICIDKIIDLPMFNQELNEDADCFVDYTFPINRHNRVVLPQRRYSTEVSMISKEVTFSTVTKHSLTVPTSTNLNDLFTSLVFPSLDFNIWCRFYRSTPVDHVIAKAILPIGRICALKQEFDESGGMKIAKDKVCLPLLTVASPLSVQYPTKMSGTMEVTILYKNFNVKEQTLERPPSNTSSRSSGPRNQNCTNQPDYHYKTSDINSTKFDSCCNNINYNTIPRSSSKNVLKPDTITSSNCLGTEPKMSVHSAKEKSKHDQALSPIQELSVKSNSETDQIENLRQSLERLVERAENNETDRMKNKENDNSESSLESDLEKYRNVVQLESSSDEGLDSIIPKVNPSMRKTKDKTRHNDINQHSDYQASKKGNPRSVDSDNIGEEVHGNFDELNLSEDDTLKSLSSVNSDDSSSHVGFIAFNKDFDKNNYNKKNIKEPRKETSETSRNTKQRSRVKPQSIITQTKCTQTLEPTTPKIALPVSKKQLGSFFKAKIEIERGINLPLLAPYGSVNKQKPSSYVSFDAYINGNLEHITSEIIYDCTDPVWNASWNVMLPIEYLYKCDKKFIINVMLLSHIEDGPVRACVRKEENRTRSSNPAHTTSSSRMFKGSERPKGAVRKQACIDLNSLCAGLNLILGWYSLVNESTPCTGQIKVKITPLEDISKHKSIWFKEYMEWEKNCKSLSSYTSSKKEYKQKSQTTSVESKLDTAKLTTIKKADSIDRDLVYISLNQKLSELDKISESFKDKYRSDHSYPSTSSKNTGNTYERSIYQEKEPSTSKDVLDLNIDKDISFINKLLSEVPSIYTNSSNKYNSTDNLSNQRSYLEKNCDHSRQKNVLRLTNDIPYYPEGVKISEESEQTTNSNNSDIYHYNSNLNFSSEMKNNFGLNSSTNNGNNSKEFASFLGETSKNRTGSMSNKPNEPLNESFNASDILDLEESRTEKPSYNRNYANNRDFNHNCEEITLSNDKTDSKSDDNLNKIVTSEQNLSPYHSFSPEVSLEKQSKSESSYVPLEFHQPCSGLDTQSCIFNNRKVLDHNNSDGGRFQRYSPLNSVNAGQINFTSVYVGTPAERLSCESERSEVISKDVETLSGQSSLCTDDQSVNYSEQLLSQGDISNHDVSENAENINSDLMEEASSEIDRILRELKKH